MEFKNSTISNNADSTYYTQSFLVYSYFILIIHFINIALFN